jgi:hypothetical protein
MWVTFESMLNERSQSQKTTCVQRKKKFIEKIYQYLLRTRFRGSGEVE